MVTMLQGKRHLCIWYGLVRASHRGVALERTAAWGNHLAGGLTWKFSGGNIWGKTLWQLLINFKAAFLCFGYFQITAYYFLSIDHLMLRWAKGSDLPWPIYRQDESHFQNNDFFIICFTLSSFPFPYLWILSDDILNMIFSPGPLQASREVKDILVQCWLFNAKYVLLIVLMMMMIIIIIIVLVLEIIFDSRDRPDFPSLAQTLERLPKKRLARFSNQTLLLSNANSVRFLLLPANCIWWVLIYRSPSHPIHLSRSAEALFWGRRLPSSQDVQVSRISWTFPIHSLFLQFPFKKW